jgi:ferrous iron transport protein A
LDQMMQLSVNSDAPESVPPEAPNALRRLVELRSGEQAILERLELPEEDARRLMELGFLPGHSVTPALAAPGGDPRVFRVDGSEIALRRETAARLFVRCATPKRQ